MVVAIGPSALGKSKGWGPRIKNRTMGILEIIKERERKEGRVEGGHIRALSISRKLREKGLALAEIAEITGLTPQEIGKC